MENQPILYSGQKQIMAEIRQELERAKKKHPRWPTHIVAGAAIVCEESGELVREALNFKYEGDINDPVIRAQAFEKMRKEAIQVAATAIRFIENLK